MEKPEQLSSPTGWTDTQWERVYQTVSEEANKASVAGAFLPCYGPLSRSAEVVRGEELQYIENGDYLKVDDAKTIDLWTLSVQVRLTQGQLAEDNLSGALLAFRRAANLLMRAEDAITFRGDPRRDLDGNYQNWFPKGARGTIDEEELDKIIGLLQEGQKLPAPPFGGHVPHPYAENLVRAVAGAIAELEKHGHLSPFACVMGDAIFVEAHTPTGSLVMPSDRMEPMLGRPLLRSSILPANEAIVVSLAGDPIDLVVATAPTVQFLRVTDEAQYVFRVYERFALRIKEDKAVSWFRLVEEEEDNDK